MRVKRGFKARKRRKKVLKLAKGYRGGRSKLYRTAADAVDKALMYAYRDRKVRKRDFRQLWIARINAAARMNDLSYSKFIHGLKLANVEIDRKVLADLAISDPAGFTKIAELAAQKISHPELSLPLLRGWLIRYFSFMKFGQLRGKHTCGKTN